MSDSNDANSNSSTSNGFQYDGRYDLQPNHVNVLQPRRHRREKLNESRDTMLSMGDLPHIKQIVPVTSLNIFTVPEVIKKWEYKITIYPSREISIFINNSRKHCTGTITCYDSDQTELWSDKVNTHISATTGNTHFVSIGCFNGSLFIYTPLGRRLFPCIMLGPSYISHMTCSDEDPLLLCVTGEGSLNLWDLAKRTNVVQNNLNEITNNGEHIKDIQITSTDKVLVVLNTGSSFVHDTCLKCWSRIADNNYQESEYHNGLLHSWRNYAPMFPLEKQQYTNIDLSDSNQLIEHKHRTSSSNFETFSHIENQIACAESIGSLKEVKQWLYRYTTKLLCENQEDKLNELCAYLLGPKDRKYWNAEILGFKKILLLEKVLELINISGVYPQLILYYKNALRTLR